MNILPLPVKFDLNEWFIIISLVVTYTWIFLLKRRFPYTIIILFIMFSLSLEKATDLILEYPPYSLYYLNDRVHYELFDLFVCYLYPVFGYIFIHYYDKWNIRGFSIFYYIMGWSVIATGVEGVTVLAHIFIYRGWKLVYSYPVYLVVLSLYILFYHFIQHYFKKSKMIINDILRLFM